MAFLDSERSVRPRGACDHARRTWTAEEGLENDLEVAAAKGKRAAASCQRLMTGMFLCVMCLYFLPMLVFIPIALAGGIHLTNPFAAEYYAHDGAPGVAQPSAGAPTGPWFWDMSIVYFMVATLPISLIMCASFLKTCLAPKRKTDLQAET
mmetsp:Transcript_37314/g.99265  ORF Transcript_37314/g.99265 Transcript_37314/m.99265 type:complete len:151 (-) Transcript_37314:113-565(-)